MTNCPQLLCARYQCGRSGVRFPNRSNRHSVANGSPSCDIFSELCCQDALSRGDESRHSLHASTYYRECNIVLILIWLLTIFKTTRNGKRLFFVFMVFRFVAVHVVNRELLSMNEMAPILVAAVPASTTLQHNTNNYEEFCFVNTFVYLMVT